MSAAEKSAIVGRAPRARNGFTLIEISIVIAILTTMMLPFLGVYVSMYQQFRAISMQVDVKSDADAAVAKIFRRTGRGQATLAADNHGLAFSDGSSVRWEGGRLLLQAGGVVKPLLPERVTEFNVVRRPETRTLTINLVVTAPARVHGQTLAWRYLYDYPRVSELR